MRFGMRPASEQTFPTTPPLVAKPPSDEYGRCLWHVDQETLDKLSSDDGKGVGEQDLEVPTDDRPANVVGSRVGTTNYHRPVLDIDFGARLIPSSTPNHYHLYLDGLYLEWEQYEKLLDVLAEVGVVSPAYRDFSVARGQTCVRLPHVKKPEANDKEVF